jgi:hypothetical protein
VLDTFLNEGRKSIRSVAREEGMPSISSIHRILREAKFHPYKIQSHQELKPSHRINRVNHARSQLLLIANNPEFLSHVLFSDEAHFSLHGNVNHHNFRFWSDVNPAWFREEPLHSPRLTVWAAIGRPGVIGPCFIYHNVTGASYLQLLQEQFLPSAQLLPTFPQLILMQDGAPPHFALIVRNWLTETLPGRWMGRGSNNLPWPANSPDLTPCDFFLWGYVKSLVYRTQPVDLFDLQTRIENVFQTLPQDMINRSVEAYQNRLLLCIDVRGSSVE